MSKETVKQFDVVIAEIQSKVIKDASASTGQKDNTLASSVYIENIEEFTKQIKTAYASFNIRKDLPAQQLQATLDKAKAKAHNIVKANLIQKINLKNSIKNITYTKTIEKQNKIVGEKILVLNVNSRMRANKSVEEPNYLTIETSDLKDVLNGVKEIRLVSEPQLPDCSYFNKNYNGCDFHLNILNSQIATGNILETNALNRNNSVFKLSIKPRRIGATYMIDVMSNRVFLNPPKKLDRILNFTLTDTQGQLLPLEKDICRIVSAYINTTQGWVEFTLYDHDVNSGDKLRFEEVSYNNGNELFNREFLAIVKDKDTVAIKLIIAEPTDAELAFWNGGADLPVDDPNTPGTNEYSEARAIALEAWKNGAISVNNGKMYIINNTVNFSLEFVLASA